MKTSIKVLGLATLLYSLASAPAALALDTGGVKIKGNINQSVQVKNALNMAIGSNAKAGMSVASIHGGTEIQGNVTQKVKADNLLNMAIGSKTVACMELASIGDNPACR